MELLLHFSHLLHIIFVKTVVLNGFPNAARDFGFKLPEEIRL